MGAIYGAASFVGGLARKNPDWAGAIAAASWPAKSAAAVNTRLLEPAFAGRRTVIRQSACRRYWRDRRGIVSLFTGVVFVDLS
jgi:hypothetical protein